MLITPRSQALENIKIKKCDRMSKQLHKIENLDEILDSRYLFYLFFIATRKINLQRYVN